MINVIFTNMPLSIRGTHTCNADGSYTILLNDRLSSYQQRKVYFHEMYHITRDDLLGYVNADLIEEIIRK
ncbi:MAG: ImmA/IrrE family metallo-endopeptidase [Saccharofermentanales bacterium]|jgi:hypothetical protein